MPLDPLHGVEVVRTTGFCGMCDSTFRNELALRFPDRRLRDGFSYVELRHLDEPDLAELRERVAAAGLLDSSPPGVVKT